MPADRFLDTNIILYAYDRDAGAKRDVAQSILEDALRHPHRTAVSLQVLQEFFVNFVRRGNSIEETTTLIDDLTHLSVIENTLALFRTGLTLQSRWQLSLWDSMILAAAKASGAKELITEDLNHGQDYGGVRAINPFI
jgi:predicted nucleic acid-binding protein